MAVLNIYVCKNEGDAKRKAEIVKQQGARKAEIIPRCSQVSLYNSEQFDNEKVICENFGKENDFLVIAVWD
ncbi:MAG: hypothetical protein HZA47_01140 [Planctomycetes bacterium]|uniref:hypothetical protein n=1 Tax=Candidatus Wunengus sp. YC65 TaxID=3367701 RepID=UPI001D9CCF3C|nr:hypothetical protein [Planctomycetota bacterium]